MNFKMVSTISGISSSGGAVAALLAAWYGAGVWSLLARDIVPSFVLWFLVWRFVNVRFSGNWNRTDCIKLLHESMKFNISRILEVGFFRAPFIFIGQIFGQVSLGLFSQGFYLASLPNVFLGPISERVAFAGYAMVSGDTDKISRGLFMANFLIIRLAAPIGMGIFLFGDQVIYLLYGQKWHLAGEIFSALGLFSAINILFTHVKTACLGIGKRNFVNHAYLLLVSGLALIIQISSQLGSIKYLSVGYGVAMTIGLAYMLIRLHRHGINLRLTELLFLPLLYSVVVLVLVYVEKVELTTNAHDLFYLIAITVMYPVLVLVFEGKKIRQVLRPRT
jgi:O-antigen/teichoic acid export membrane protein